MAQRHNSAVMSRAEEGSNENGAAVNDEESGPAAASDVTRRVAAASGAAAADTPANGNGVQDEENDGGANISLSELMYSAASYHAISKPVTLTMVLAALAVVYINTPETLEQGQEQLAASYTVFDTNPSEDSDSKTLGLSLVNALIIVSVICAMTFLIVLLYKYRCLKVLMGYMIIASATLLGVLGGTMFEVAIDKYKLDIDKFSFYFFMYNFAIVGTFSIFFANGVPLYMTQAYLIATSVILAWQLAHFDPWTSWCLLVMLALYDLCAVLTPCGPLKCLIKVMTQDDSPGIMPGLLYEAQLPEGAQRPQRQPVQPQESNNSNSDESRRRRRRRDRPRRRDTEATVEESSVATTERSASGSLHSTVVNGETSIEMSPSSESCLNVATTRESHENANESTGEPSSSEKDADSLVKSPIDEATSTSLPAVDEHGFPVTLDASSGQQESLDNASEEASPPPESAPVANNNTGSQTQTADDVPPASSTDEPPPTGILPLAIAKLYRLRLVEPVEPARPETAPTDEEGQDMSPNALLARRYTPEQLCMQVEAIFPRNGGSITVLPPRRPEDRPRYEVRDRHGIVKRRLLIDENGRVLEERPRTDRPAKEDNTIKLGLGDFIFYSILVATAALYSFTTFAACTLVVLAGLGFTLILLAVYHHALPALPISILLGVIFYFLTRASIEPWIEAIFRNAYYV